MPLRKILFLFVVSWAQLLIVPSPSATEKLERPACRVGSNATRAGFWAWGYGSRVKVYMRSNDFTVEESKSLLQSLEIWNRASVLTKSGVMLEYVGTTDEAQVCENCLTIVRGKPAEKGKRHTAADLIAYGDYDQILTRATVVINPSLTNLDELGEVMAHELGHTFGLFDCYTCTDRSTLMNQFKGLNSPNGLAGPTPCDIAQVAANYRDVLERTLAAKARRKTLQVDDGEEPVEDETPIIIPKP
jgi:hypothetical protein